MAEDKGLKDTKCKVRRKTASIRVTEHFFLELRELEDAFKATEAWLKAGLTRDLKWGVPVPKEKYKGKVFLLSDREMDSADPSPAPLTTSRVSWAPGEPVFFEDEELPPPSQNPNDDGALRLAMECRGIVLPRVLIDEGSPVNIMPKVTFDRLAFNDDERISSDLTFMGFNGSSLETNFEVMATVKAGMFESEVQFVLMNADFGEDLVLGRSWLTALDATHSFTHQKLKLPFKVGNQDGTLTIDGSHH